MKSLEIEASFFERLERVEKLLNNNTQEARRVYDEIENKIMSPNKDEMEKLQELCRKELQSGKYLVLLSEQFPRLYKEPYLFGYLLKKNGWTLFSTQSKEYKICMSNDT